MKKIITAYYRVSTKAETQKSSFTNQPKFFTTIYEMLGGKDKEDNADLVWSDTKYYDYGISGTKLSRDGFNQMLLDAGLKIKKIEEVEVEHPYKKGVMLPQTKYTTIVDKNKTPLFNQIWVKSVSRFGKDINAWDILHNLYLAGVDVWFYDADLHSSKKEDWDAIKKEIDNVVSYSYQIANGRENVKLQRSKDKGLKKKEFKTDFGIWPEFLREYADSNGYKFIEGTNIVVPKVKRVVEVETEEKTEN